MTDGTPSSEKVLLFISIGFLGSPQRTLPPPPEDADAESVFRPAHPITVAGAAARPARLTSPALFPSRISEA